MRIISNNLKAVIAAGAIKSFVLVDIRASRGGAAAFELHHTSLPYDVILNGVTYISDNSLYKLDAPRQSNIVDRETFKIVYADPTFNLRDTFEDGIVGADVVVRNGVFNNTGATLYADDVAYEQEQPLLGTSDLLTTYIGIVDSHGTSVTEDGVVTTALECASPMANLDAMNPFLTTNDAINEFNPTDTAFRDAYLSSSSVNYLWGKTT